MDIYVRCVVDATTWSAQNSACVSAAADTHYKAIMQELLAALNTREWRNREAACLGIAGVCHARFCIKLIACSSA